MDLSRHKLDVHVLNQAGDTVTATWARPTVEGLRELAGRVALYGDRVTGVVESMTGGRFVHDQLELAGWDVEIADALKAKALAARGEDRPDRCARARRARAARSRASRLAA
jgi:hypothetical protein